MSARQALAALVDRLPEERVAEVLRFARFLIAAHDLGDFQAAGRAQFARAYGDDEPEHSEADIRPETKP